MPEVRQTEKFEKWFVGLRDVKARTRIAARIRRLELGLLGDVEPVGEGVSELRDHYGPGYRLYFTMIGEDVVILLCGGDKTSQSADIKRAKALAKQL